MRLALAALLFAACAVCSYESAPMPDCAPSDHGGSVCVGTERERWIIGQGALAWAEVYAEEWGEDDAGSVAADTTVVWGPLTELEACPCEPCNVGGCMDPNGSRPVVWVNTRNAAGIPVYPPWETALQHELVHAAEWQLEQVIDYDHDREPQRWGELLARAKERWAWRLSSEEEP